MEPQERKLYGPEYREMWGEGPWNDEPDEIVWTDDNGYLCVMRRNTMGVWCGYVAVDSSHPAHGIHGEDVAGELRCNWGVTWSGFDAPWQDSEKGIGDRWWFGFDFCHVTDYTPGLANLFSNSPLQALMEELVKDMLGVLGDDVNASSPLRTNVSNYKTVEFVKGQVTDVAIQLVAYATLRQLETSRESDS